MGSIPRAWSQLGCSTSPRCSPDAEVQLVHFRLRTAPAGTAQSRRAGAIPQDVVCRQTGAVKRSRQARAFVAAAAAASLHSSNGSQPATVAGGAQPAAAARAAAAEPGLAPETADARTDFVAETLLPTASGKFRLRGYRHTVRVVSSRRSSAALYTPPHHRKTCRPLQREVLE